MDWLSTASFLVKHKFKTIISGKLQFKIEAPWLPKQSSGMFSQNSAANGRCAIGTNKVVT